MPTTLVRNERDEELWDKAKEIVREEYGRDKEDGPRFYRLVTGIFQRMKRKRKSKESKVVALKKSTRSATVVSERPRLVLKAERWITIHPHGKDYVNTVTWEKDYRRVLIDDKTGTILGGSVPKWARGEHVRGWWKKPKQREEKNPPKLSQHLQEHGVQHNFEEAEFLSPSGEKRQSHKYRIGNGLSYTKDKFGRPTPAKGTIHFKGVYKIKGWGDGIWVKVDANYHDIGGASEQRKKELKDDLGMRFLGETKSWYVPLKNVPKLASKFAHAEIEPQVAHRYEKLYDGHEEAKKAEPMRTAPKTPAEKAHMVSIADVPDDILRDAGLSVVQQNLARQLRDPKMVEQLNAAHLKALDDAQHKLNLYLDRNPKLRDELLAKAAENAPRGMPKENEKEITTLQHPKGLKRDQFTAGDLWDYQKKGVNWLVRRKGGILGHGVGLGKTIQSITAAMVAMEKPDGPKRFVVIVPAKRLYGWAKEIEKFTDKKPVVIDGTPKQREKAYKEAENADFVIATYGMLQKEPDKLHALAPDGVIVDEAHRLKGDSLQARNFESHWKNAEYKFLLTATPMPNNPLELYRMVNHVAPGALGSYRSFLQRFAVTDKIHVGGRTIEKPIGYKNLNALRDLVEPYIFMKDAESPDVSLELPEKHQVRVDLTMTSDQQRLYNRIREGIADEIKSMDEDEWQKNAANVLVKLQKLEQVAIDPAMVDPSIKKSPKIEWVAEQIEDHFTSGDSRGVVVFSHYKEPIEHLKQELVDRGFAPDKIAVIQGAISPQKSQEIEDGMNNGKYQVLIATDAAQEGMNLQKGANELIHLDQLWTPAGMEQREGRVHRQGQKSRVRIFSPVMNGSIEEHKLATLAQKQEWIDAVLGGGDVKNAAKHLTLDDVKKLLGVG